MCCWQCVIPGLLNPCSFVPLGGKGTNVPFPLMLMGCAVDVRKGDAGVTGARGSCVMSSCPVVKNTGEAGKRVSLVLFRLPLDS